MIAYYVVRDVVRGANCSYPYGRTLCREVFKFPEDARLAVACYNSKCNVPGVCYHVLPHPDDVLVDADHYENGDCTVPVTVLPALATPGYLLLGSKLTGNVLCEDGQFGSLNARIKLFRSEDEAREFVKTIPQPYRKIVFA